ncbi:OmpH family outer membrane protein [Falsirhodobacter sp. 1013]|uniref:OmpH family outer membrane protein n=1 Tax=Falsirhodobacter sp. 1013 TaxID=3417566 RepID=UPI003EB773F9
MLRALLLVLALWPATVVAQTPEAAAESPILTVVPDRLFDEARAGKAAQTRLDDATRALMVENRRMEAELEAEERDLTAKRDTMPPAEFRKLADAFDAKAERTRTEQDAKSRRLTRMREEDRQAFFKAALPVLAQLMQDEGALAILDRGSVFVSFDLIDVTTEAIARLDTALGDGAELFGNDPAP